MNKADRRMQYLKHQKDERGIDALLLLGGFEPTQERLKGEGLTEVQVSLYKESEDDPVILSLGFATNLSRCGCGEATLDGMTDECWGCEREGGVWRHAPDCGCEYCEDAEANDPFVPSIEPTVVSAWDDEQGLEEESLPTSPEEVEALILQTFGEAGREALVFAVELSQPELSDEDRLARFLEWQRHMAVRYPVNFEEMWVSNRSEPSLFWGSKSFN